MDNEKNKQMNAEMSAALFSERERFEMLFAEHWKKIAVIGVLIALVVALVFVAWGITNRSAIKAAHAFADAADVPALEKALAENAGKKGALTARQRLVQLYIDGKKYDEALKQLKLVAADPDADSNIRGNAVVTEGLIYELQGKNKEAADLLAKTAASANYRNGVRLNAAAAAGRLLAAVDPSRAATVLEQASKLMADTPVAKQALESVQELKLALANGEFGAKPKAKTPKAK